MTSDQVNKIMDAVEDGCMVRIEGAYTDGFAEIFEGSDGKPWIVSEVWRAQRLEDYPLSRIKVYRPVDCA